MLAGLIETTTRLWMVASMVYRPTVSNKILALVLALLPATTLQASEVNGFDVSNPLVPSNEIHWGGVGRDAIPAIDAPKFVTPENAEFLVQIKIQSIEKGTGYKKGDYIFAYAYQRKDDAPRVPASSGHSSIPEEELLIRAHIKRGKGQMEALYPDWLEVLPPLTTKAHGKAGAALRKKLARCKRPASKKRRAMSKRLEMRRGVTYSLFTQQQKKIRITSIGKEKAGRNRVGKAKQGCFARRKPTKRRSQ